MVDDTLPILTGVNPPWWVAIAAGHQAEVGQLFTARPSGTAQWLAWNNLHPTSFFVHIEVPGLPLARLSHELVEAYSSSLLY